jgi:heat shock protein 4
MEDTDVSATVNREEFLELARPISERLLKPINDALAAAGMSPNDIHFVELIGGSTRLPVVKETLATYFGGSLDGENKLSTTLNQDEAVARGCALQCAILSPVFKVRDFEVQDWNGMAMELNWDPKDVPVPKNGDGAITTMEAFSLGNAIPSSKILTFYRDIKPEELAAGTNDVSFVIHGKYTGGQDIGSWKINGIKQFPSTETKDADGNVLSAKGNIKIKVKLDVNCLLAIESAVQTEDVIVPDESEENKGIVL